MPSNLTLGELYKEWADIKYKNISKATANNYKASWIRLSRHANLKVTDIHTVHLQEVVDQCSKDGMSRSTLEKLRTTAVMLFNYALENNIVNTNCAKFLKLPKIEKPPKTKTKKAVKKKSKGSVVFRERIKILMKERKIMREDLGASLGLSPREIDRYLDGFVRPSLQLLKKIGDFFGVSIDYLVGTEVDGDDLKIQMIQRAYTMSSAKDKKYIEGMVKIMVQGLEKTTREGGDTASAVRNKNV